MEKAPLEEFHQWKELNKRQPFSLYDYLFHISSEKKLPPDLYFAFVELFWPTFVTYNNYVFLQEHFSMKKFEELKKSGKPIEFWMNFLTLDPFFEHEEKAAFLAKSLVEIWQEKLKHDFPHKNFIVKYLCDVEYGNYGLTFFQDRLKTLSHDK